MEVFNQRTYYEIEYTELNDLIRREFIAPEYDVLAMEGWTNDTAHTGIIKLVWYSDYDKKRVQEFFMSKPPYKQYQVSWVSLLCELASRGTIPEGEYLIQVSW